MPLSNHNKMIIIDMVSSLGKKIEGKLQPTKEIPNRNPYAHIWKEIKNHFGKSYKDCEDEDMKIICEILEKISLEFS